MIYGYCRISTGKQSIDRQTRNIKAVYPEAVIVEEVYTGTKFQGRDKLDKVIKTVKEGDSIVFDSVSRMSRNSEEGMELYREMFERGISLVFLKEPHINTDTYKAALSNQFNMTGDDVDILLFDEPLANLDPATGKKAIALIDEIQKNDNKTILIIEHRLEDALYCDADRIIVVTEGRIAADMTPDELMCTDVLEKAGVREPLYVTALKCAGCELFAEEEAGQISTLHVERHAENVRKWYEQVKREKQAVAAEEILSIRDVSFAYSPQKKTLNNIDFEINKGEMMAIVGKNGAGKTTLSNLICGFITPDKGDILLSGEDISPLSVKERGERIGLVMQNPNQMISKAMIFDEVALGLRVRGVDEETVKEKVHETLKICGLYPFRNWPISALSFGQRKRVTIASILVMGPEIMILDEPTAGQDYRHYTEIMEFLKRINEESGTTIIMITHDMHLMLEYTRRAVVIADGYMLADNTPTSILTNDEISNKAYLKRTSLYDLAKACGIEDADSFTDAFIIFEREKTRMSQVKAHDEDKEVK